jgi:DNA-directed RNA polymerase specialized sigma24 family protein
MAGSFAEAIAKVEGPEFDAIVGYAVPPPKATPTEKAVKVAFEGLDYEPFRKIARMLSFRYRCHETHAEEAVQDELVALYVKRPDLFREDPRNWLGLLYEVARFRLIEILGRLERTASIEGLTELAGDAPFDGARPCVPPSLDADEEAKYGPMPSEGEDWSRTQIIGALQRFRDYYGRPPRVKECKAVHGLPSPVTIYRHFGDFPSAILATGMVPETLGLRRKQWSPIEAARTCLSFRRRNGYWPNWADVKRNPGELPSTTVMIKYFGGTRSVDVQLGAEAILCDAGEVTS